MNISDAKRFEYTLSLFKECLGGKHEKYPYYQIIWKIENKLIVGHLLRWSDSYFPRVAKLKIDNEFNVYDDILPIDDSHQDVFPRDLRNQWFDKYQTDWGGIDQLYLNPEALLLECINFVSSNKFAEITDIQPLMYDVSYLQNSVKLDFLKLDVDCQIEPVSLIQSSQN